MCLCQQDRRLRRYEGTMVLQRMSAPAGPGRVRSMDDDCTIGTIHSRRTALVAAATAGLSLFGARAAGRRAPRVDLVATPELTEGPFFVDTRLNRSDLTDGTDRRWVTEGLPLRLRLAVYELDGKVGTPLPGAMVDLWHADAAGVYSGEPSSQIQHEDTRGQSWLRGFQMSDGDGRVEFRTIYPGWYVGRTIHIHFKVRMLDEQQRATYDFTSQLFFGEEQNDAVLAKPPYDARGPRRVRNERDGIYMARQADGTVAGRHLTAALRDDDEGKLAEFAIAFDLQAVRRRRPQ